MKVTSVFSPGSVLCEDETIGPIFMKEPANRVDFSNTTGATVECAARGSPTPDVFWVRSDGTAVGDVPGLRQVGSCSILFGTVVADSINTTPKIPDLRRVLSEPLCVPGM